MAAAAPTSATATLARVVIVGAGFAGLWAARALKDAAVSSWRNATNRLRYRDFGTLATIGRHAAVVEYAGWRISGLAAWLFWLFVHMFFLIGFRNRLVVMLDWGSSYLSFERYARIIVDRQKAN